MDGTFDLIGIGALNLDLIVTHSHLQRIDGESASEFIGRFEKGKEKRIRQEELEKILSKIPQGIADPSLGGSAFNTVLTIASMRLGLRLGFIGIAGKTEISQLKGRKLDFRKTLDTEGVVTSLVFPSESISGLCLSSIEEAERSLLTSPGANTEMADYLSQKYEQILKCLTRTTIVHVTSFFDDKTPKILAQLLAEAKEANPLLKVSFDPGYVWVETLSDDVRSILKLTDYLFLNDDEFKLLGMPYPSAMQKDLASNIFDLYNTKTLLIVVKQYDATQLFSVIDGRIIPLEHKHTPLRPESIEDATGAGDVFAGGFLAALLLSGLEIHDGVKLGLRLVKSKLLASGSTNFHNFRSIFADLVDEMLKVSGTEQLKSVDQHREENQTIASDQRNFFDQVLLILLVPSAPVVMFLVGRFIPFSINLRDYIILIMVLITCGLLGIGIVGSRTPNIHSWRWFPTFQKVKIGILFLLVFLAVLLFWSEGLLSLSFTIAISIIGSVVAALIMNRISP